MSKSASSFKLLFPSSNPVLAVSLFDATGAAVATQTVVDGTTAHAGFACKDITLAANAEPLFATPTFTNPESPNPVYLVRHEGTDDLKVLDESVFDPASPGRPTPAVTSAQEFYLYETLSNAANGGKIYTVKAPQSPVAIIKSKGKDPLTGATLAGNNILFRYQGKCPTLLEVEADVEDIADPRGFVPVEVANATTYSESSVGLAMVAAQDQIVPRDGIGHAVNFRLRYNVHGDPGAWVAINGEFITYDLAAPNAPASLAATLLRDRDDVITDIVKLDWTKAALNPGTGIEIGVTDHLGKKHTIYSSTGNETTARVENVSRFIVQDTGPAVARPYRFWIVATNLSAKSDVTYADPPLSITSKVKYTAPPTPDEMAGTARDVIPAVLKAEVYADVLSQLGSLPESSQTIVNAAIDKLLLRIKDVIAKGGSVALQDFGVIAAKWTNERMGRNPATGEPVLIPSSRSLSFKPSTGFKAGTKAGSVMTDAQADALP